MTEFLDWPTKTPTLHGTKGSKGIYGVLANTVICVHLCRCDVEIRELGERVFQVSWVEKISRGRIGVLLAKQKMGEERDETQSLNWIGV